MPLFWHSFPTSIPEPSGRTKSKKAPSKGICSIAVFASVIFLISGLFSILFLFLAIISEYISRILIETKNRPLYYIQQEITQMVK